MAIATSKTKAMAKSAKKATPSADQLSDPKKLAAAGAALMALPFAAQGIAKLTGSAREKVGEGEGKAAEGGGMFGSDDDSDSDEDGGGSAVGSGRRMPIQQSIDVAAPLEVTYNLWTQFEEWPSYMHRVDSVEQVDDCTVAISTKVWGITKRFEAEINEQRPDERIEWDVSEGLTHSGVVTFHELAPRLTRIEVSLDVQPDSLLEKAGRGMRFAKRAVRGDLHRFKAYAEIEEGDEGGWRGTIEDGEVKRKTERKSSGGSRSNGRSSGRSHNGSDPTSGTRKSGSRS